MRIKNTLGDTVHNDLSTDINETFFNFIKGKNCVNKAVFEKLRMADIVINGTNFYQCIFKNCIIPQWSWLNLDLERCIFKNCRLDHSIFENTKLKSTIFEKCNINIAEFRHVKIIPPVKFNSCSVLATGFNNTNVQTIDLFDTDLQGNFKRRQKILPGSESIKISKELYKVLRVLARRSKVRFDGMIEEMLLEGLKLYKEGTV